MTIGSLFSGIGGLERGLEFCGLGPVIWQAETDAAARAVLAQHWPDVRRYVDVREIDDQAPPPELICGGFPCQDISVAGAGVGIDGERSGLWREFARIVRALQPGAVFVENVSALASRGLDEVLRDLAEIGMDAIWDCFRASDVGAPHKRERLFLLAYANRERVRQLAERDQWGGGRVRTAERGNAEPLHHRPEVADADGGRREGERLAQPGGFGSARGGLADGRGHAGYVHRFPPGPDGIDGWDGPFPAVRRGDDGLPVGLDRRWSPVNGRADRLRLLGNAVVPQCAALAWRTLAARVLDDESRAA